MSMFGEEWKERRALGHYTQRLRDLMDSDSKKESAWENVSAVEEQIRSEIDAAGPTRIVYRYHWWSLLEEVMGFAYPATDFGTCDSIQVVTGGYRSGLVVHVGPGPVPQVEVQRDVDELEKQRRELTEKIKRIPR